MTSTLSPNRTTTLRSDIVGSLLRPAWLKSARAQRTAGSIGPAAVQADRGSRRRRGDRAPAERRAGRRHRRRDAPLRLLRPLRRRRRRARQARAAGRSPSTTSRATSWCSSGPVVVAKLRRVRPMCTEEFAYLRGRTDRAAQGHADQRAAGGGLLRRREVAAAPIRRSTRTSPTSSTSCAPRWTSWCGSAAPTSRSTRRSTPACSTRRSARATAQRGTDPDKLLDRCIELDNAVIGDHPGVTFGIHLCRGNNQSMFYASGGYEPIAAGLRAHALRPLPARVRRRALRRLRAAAHVPEDRTVVLGLVTTKKPALEQRGRRSSAASTRRRATCRSSGSPSARSAASPRPKRATRSARPTRRPSSSSSPTWRTRSGATRDSEEVQIPRLRSG